MRAETLERLEAARAAKIPVALATHLRSGQQRLIFTRESEGELCLDADAMAAAQHALAHDQPTRLETASGAIFIQPFHPPLRLIVVGAVHIAEPLARMAALAGYGVTIIDPRRAFTASQGFAHAGVAVDGDWPDAAMERLVPDARTAVVTLSHDPKLDDRALDAALLSPAFYIGALGSRKAHAARLRRLAALGHGETALARIHGPVGLDIGALSPAEIAVAIVAEITAVRRRAAPRARRTPRIAAIVLAAGRSSRMAPANKLLAEIDGTPMVACAADAALASQAAPVIVVVGNEAGRVRAALAGRGVTIVENLGFAEGLSSSLRAGLEALPAGADGALVLLGDMPRVGAHHLDRLIAAFDPRAGRAICLPSFRARRGNPVLWGAAYFSEMTALTGDAGARALIARHAAQTVEVEMPDDGVLVDVDTPAELADLLGASASQSEGERVSLEELSTCDRAAFVATLGHLFESSPWVADETWPRRPFSDPLQLHAELCATLRAAPRERQLALMRAHPDLAGPRAPQRPLSADSAREQATAGLDRLGDAELAGLREASTAYRERFGFPFIICARLNSQSAIHTAMQQRLRSTPDAEVFAALREIEEIARLRLTDLLRTE
jgi:xanthine dehydrogenase accessory factor